MSQTLKLKACKCMMVAMAAATSIATMALKTDIDPRQAAFGKSYPNCNVWTDWQSICTRTAADGAIKCRQDTHQKARASATFCVAGAWTGEPWYVSDTSSQRKSRLRFCAETDEEDYGPHKIPICREYENDRPFNGTHIDTQNDAECDVVRTTSQESDVCRNDGKPGAPKCHDVQMTFRSKQPLYCAKWKDGTQCEATDKQAPVSAINDTILTPPRVKLTGSAVWAPFCHKSR